MTQPETLPLACPFCGQQPRWGKDAGGYDGAERKFLQCVNGKCPGRVPETVEAWNTRIPRSPDKPEAEAVAYLKKSIQQAIHAATKLWAEIDCEDDDPTAKAVSDISAHLQGTLIGLEQDFPKAPPLPSYKLRGLVRKWKTEAQSDCDKNSAVTGPAVVWDLCADELAALLSQEPSSGAETLEHVHITDKQAVITGDPNDYSENDPRAHNCDQMGCPTLDHVLYRLPFTDHRKPIDTKGLAKYLAEKIDFTAGPVQAREVFEQELGSMEFPASPVTGGDVEALAKELIVTFVDAKNVGYYMEGVKTVIRRHMQQGVSDGSAKALTALLADNPSAEEARYLLGISHVDYKAMLATAKGKPTEKSS